MNVSQSLTRKADHECEISYYRALTQFSRSFNIFAVRKLNTIKLKIKVIVVIILSKTCKRKEKCCQKSENATIITNSRYNYSSYVVSVYIDERYQIKHK
ncbi:MAG: hypothetical protein ACTSYD_01085 [Candidatus Heimdallarchaeaceae archaeon]